MKLINFLIQKTDFRKNTIEIDCFLNQNTDSSMRCMQSEIKSVFWVRSESNSTDLDV